jgi:hypothetical protein
MNFSLVKYRLNNLENEFKNLSPVTASHVNLLLIDKTVSNYQLFVDSSNESTYPLVYSPRYDSKLLLDHIKLFKHIKRIAVVCHGQENITKFLNNEPFNSDGNIQFMKEIVNGFNVKIIDFLACNTLKYTQWVNYFKQLNQMGITVGASDDRTGNIKYEGDWFLESTGNDIKSVYWTDLISNYSELLNESEQDGIIYSYNTISKKASITGCTDVIGARINIPPTINVNNEDYKVTTIKSFAFSDCTSLKSVSIGKYVKTIEASAFYGCISLEEFIVVPSNTKFIVNNNALYKLTDDTNECVLIQYAIGNINTNYTIQFNGYIVTTIKESAFALCKFLTNVTIGAGVQTIEFGTFEGCTSLTSVIIGSSVDNIETDVFEGCTSLKTFVIDLINTNFKEDTNSLYKLNNNNKTCELLKYAIGNDTDNYTIPATIDNYSVTSISISAFRNCTFLKSVDIPYSVKTIDPYVFRNCWYLRRVTIGSGVTSIEQYAFAYCINLKYVYIKTNNFKYSNWNKNAFYYMNKTARFYLPYKSESGTFLGYSIDILTNYVLNNVPLTGATLAILSDNYYITMNPENQNSVHLNGTKKITKYIKPTPPYKNPINYWHPSKKLDLIEQKLTYTPISVNNITKYNITKSSNDNFDKTDWELIKWTENYNSSIEIDMRSKFNFYDSSYTKVYISTNGLITFEKSNSTYSLIALNNHFNYKQIAIFFKNLVVEPNTGKYKITTDSLTIYYSGHAYENNTDKNTYEAFVKLYFNTGIIEVNYLKIDPMYSCLIGLSDGSGTDYNLTGPNFNPVEYSVIDL